MNRTRSKSWTRLGAVSIFGLCVVLVSAASQMISIEDPNAPVALVYEDPIYAAESTQDELAKSVRGPTDPTIDPEVDVEVFGVTLDQNELAVITDVPVDGVIIGDWLLDEETTPGRYVLSETSRGTVLTVVNAEGISTTSPLAEQPFTGGRYFLLTGDATGEYLILADDGSLSFGDAGGVWATVPAQR